MIDGVRDDLHRMALNLVENALLHTPPGTPVTVSVRRDDGAAVLEVADRGPGIPPEMRERVFERFTRGDPPAARPGSGLGLAIVRAAVQAHDGVVSVSSAPEVEGTRFEVRLPWTRDSGPVAVPEEAVATPPPPRAAPSAGA